MRLPWYVIVAFAGVLIVLAVKLPLDTAEMHKAYANVAAERANADFVAAAQSLLMDITDAETGQRGYLLTNDPSYLTPYKAGIDRVGADLARIKPALSPDDATRLAALTQVKLHELHATLVLQRGGIAVVYALADTLITVRRANV